MFGASPSLGSCSFFFSHFPFPTSCTPFTSFLLLTTYTCTNGFYNPWNSVEQPVRKGDFPPFFSFLFFHCTHSRELARSMSNMPALFSLLFYFYYFFSPFFFFFFFFFATCFIPELFRSSARLQSY